MKNIAKTAFFLMMISVLILCLVSCNSSKESTEEGTNDNTVNNVETTIQTNITPSDDMSDGESRILVAYFSATGHTEPLARFAVEFLNADLYQINAKIPYTEEDLRYYTDCRADREQNDPDCRPEIDGNVNNFAKYDVIFIGYPIWHGQAPKIIYTFLENYDFKGKTVIPFCTSASSPLGSSASNLHDSAPNAEWKEGKRFEIGTDKDTFCSWLESMLSDNKNNDNKTEDDTMKIHCNGKTLTVTLADNKSAKAFYEKLKQGDVTVNMDDYGDFEKVGELGFSLPQTNTQITTKPGDVILYQGSNVTIYYDVNSWNFTLLGNIADMTRESMLSFFGGKGQATVRFSLD